MTTRTETDMRSFEDALDHPTIHWYPTDPSYCRSGADVPQPGDVAMCGHVKVRPAVTDPDTLGPLTCSQCRTLKAMRS